MTPTSTLMFPHIALCGHSGAGKTTAAQSLVEEYGYLRCSTGDVCRSVCQLLYASESKTTLNRVTDALKASDPAVFLRAAIQPALHEHRSIIFDSVRYVEDWHFLSPLGFLLCRIEASREVRLERLRARGQEFDEQSDALHASETESDGIRASLVIENMGNIRDLNHDLTQMIQRHSIVAHR